ncbi:YycH protein [compost metagenome]
MDWGRAKSILILSFLFLNIVLGFQLWDSKSKETELTLDTSLITAELERALLSKNIRISKELPKDVPKLREITVKFDESIRSDEKVQLRKPTTVTNILSKATGKNSTVAAEIPHLDQYQFDSKKDGVIQFNQLFNQLPMFEVRLELFENNGQITTYQQAYVEVESGEEQKEQKVISAQIAVRSLVDKYLLDGTVITDVRLGYHGQLYNSQMQYMIPSWRVLTDNGDPYYVQAFTGAVDEPQKDTPAATTTIEPPAKK